MCAFGGHSSIKMEYTAARTSKSADVSGTTRCNSSGDAMKAWIPETCTRRVSGHFCQPMVCCLLQRRGDPRELLHLAMTQ